MVDIVTRTKKLTRDKLAKFLPNHESIKAFEDITHDVITTLPDAIASIGSDDQPVLAGNMFSNRQSSAGPVGGVADSAQLLATQIFGA